MADNSNFPSQFELPGILVRNTFIDWDDAPAAPQSLVRARTAPPPTSATKLNEDDGTGRQNDDMGQLDNYGDPDDLDDDDDMPPPPPPDALHRLKTRDWYENQEQWGWSNSGPSAPPHAVSAQQPPMMYNQPAVHMVPMPMMPLHHDAPLPHDRMPGQSQAGVRQGGGFAAGGATPKAISSGAASDEPSGLTAMAAAPPQPQTLTRMLSASSGHFRIHWTVDARKLRGNDKQAVSPPFELSFGAQYPTVTFKMMIYPKVVNDNKGGASFKKARGKGFIQLKCEAELSEAVANVSFRFSIGSHSNLASPRGPVFHNFSSSAVCGLPKEQEEWDFQTVVDTDSMTFLVCLEIATQLAMGTGSSGGP